MKTSAILTICSFALLLVIIFPSTTSLSTSECEKVLGNADRCYTKILGIGDRNFTRTMRSDNDVNVHCKSAKNNLKCFKSYGKCLKSLPKTMFNIIYTGARKEVNARCTTQESRNEYMKTSQSTADNKLTYDKIVEKLTNYYVYTVNDIPTDDQLSYLCCGYHYFNDEMYQEVTSTSNEDAAVYIKKSVANLFADLMDFTCGQYPSTPVCVKKLPKSKKSYDNMKPYTTIYRHGVFVPLAQFAQQLMQ